VFLQERGDWKTPGEDERSGAFRPRQYVSIKAVDGEQIFCLALAIGGAR
jgi:hypothetical protein